MRNIKTILLLPDNTDLPKFGGVSDPRLVIPGKYRDQIFYPTLTKLSSEETNRSEYKNPS